MAIVSISIKGSNGSTLNIDAWQNNRQQSVRTPAVVDEIALFASYDNTWRLTFGWATDYSATAQLKDANINNPSGSNVLRVISNGDGTFGAYVDGRETSDATAWNILAAGPISDFSALPVQLFQRVNNTPYYIGANNGPPPSTGTPILVSEGPINASTWTIRPFAPYVANPAYEAFTVEGVSVKTMITTLWNAIVGTEWANKFAPTLIAWMYDFPTTIPSGGWNTFLTTRLYTLAYKPYFVDRPAKPDFGTGSPPNAPPPEALH